MMLKLGKWLKITTLKDDIKNDNFYSFLPAVFILITVFLMVSTAIWWVFK
jgi:hypothetical protein